MNHDLCHLQAAPEHPLSQGKPLHAWGDSEAGKSFLLRHAGNGFSTMMKEIDLLMDRKFPLALAFVVGEISAFDYRELEQIAARQPDYVSWVVTGPVMIAAFPKRMYADLLPAYNNISYVEGQARLADGGVAILRRRVSFFHSRRIP